MFDRTSSLPGAAAKGSAISQGLSLLGTAGGIGVAILGTPLVFGFTQGPLGSYLSRAWGDIAPFLTFLMGCIEFALIFAGSRLLITIAATAAIVSLAARRIPHA